MNSSISSFPNPSSDQTLKPVYLITENPSQKHIAFLLDIFRKNILPVKVQKEKDSLGITPKEKCFVVVDNKKGVITLGS